MINFNNADELFYYTLFLGVALEHVSLLDERMTHVESLVNAWRYADAIRHETISTAFCEAVQAADYDNLENDLIDYYQAFCSVAKDGLLYFPSVPSGQHVLSVDGTMVHVGYALDMYNMRQCKYEDNIVSFEDFQDLDNFHIVYAELLERLSFDDAISLLKNSDYERVTYTAYKIYIWAHSLAHDVSDDLLHALGLYDLASLTLNDGNHVDYYRSVVRMISPSDIVAIYNDTCQFVNLDNFKRFT